MRHACIVILAAGIVAAGTFVAPSLAQEEEEGGRVIKAVLRGIEEPPSVSSTGRGNFRGTISEDGSSLKYNVSYNSLEGDILQSHIHLGQKGVNGGIAVFLCTNLGNGPAGTPLCPGTRSGAVSGTLTGAEIVGPSGQGLTTGEWQEFLNAITRNVTYVNVHTTKHTGGEIRGQIDNENAQ
jgi:hypothetical protein